MCGRLPVLISVCALALTLVACAPSRDPAAIVRTACTRCHDAERIRRNSSRGRDYWQQTVERMRERGAAVNAGQVDAVVEFLSSGGASSL